MAAMAMDFTVVSDGGRSSKTQLGKHELRFDMPKSLGGEGKGPGPLAYFVVSAAACFFYYASGQLLERGLSTDELTVNVKTTLSDTKPPYLETMRLEVRLPAGASDELREAVDHVVRTCPVHSALVHPPELTIETV